MIMKSKIIILILLMISLAGCTNNNEERYRDEVDLNNVDKEDIEENINGYDIGEDENITDDMTDKNRNILAQLNQRLNTQILDTGYVNDGTILEEYQSNLPEGIKDKGKYSYYDIGYNYYLITDEEGFEVRDHPSENGGILGRLNYLDKVSLLERVQGEVYNDSDIWYRVAFFIEDELKSGYLHSASGVLRSYRFNEMYGEARKLIHELAQGELNYIRNYKNLNGAPPKKGDSLVDEHGYRAYHSAPGYTEADTNSEFRYIPDGMLVRILNEVNDFYYVDVPTFGSNFYVPKQYIDTNDILHQLNHVIVVDRGMQNQAAFEIAENGLNLISHTLATTGVAGERSYETTLGSYKALEKKERFYYLGSGVDKIAGYAPFAIRFTGGAYIHGIPVAYHTENEEQYDPGTIEYLETIGTFPRSSMCVRNYTSHAEFLYNWMDIDNGAVIVIE